MTTYDPPVLLADAWNRLRAGRDDGGHAFRTAALATADALGRPDARTVVLRRVDEAARTLDFQTDRRSPKFFGLQHNAAAAWLFYDPADKLQLRLHASVTLHASDPVAHDEWDRVPEKARESYRQAVAPGAELESGVALPPTMPDGRANFVVVRCRVESLEWLRLEGDTWRRLRFDWRGNALSWQWVAP